MSLCPQHSSSVNILVTRPGSSCFGHCTKQPQLAATSSGRPRNLLLHEQQCTSDGQLMYRRHPLHPHACTSPAASSRQWNKMRMHMQEAATSYGVMHTTIELCLPCSLAVTRLPRMDFPWASTYFRKFAHGQACNLVTLDTKQGSSTTQDTLRKQASD